MIPGSRVIFGGATAALLAAQPVWAAATQVTAVRLSPTNRGLNVVLQTASGDRPQIFTSSRGNALVADIVNTQLRLPQGNSFRQDNPAPGIASVTVTQLDPNSVRLVVAGTTNAPSSQPAAKNAQGITFSVTPAAGTPTAQQPTAIPVPQPQQTPAQTPGVLVPNPDVRIDGAPTPPTATPTPPPFLPRAVAPPVGDIAVSNTDSSPSTINLETTERVPRLVLRDAPVREVLALLARAAGLNLAFSAAPAPGSQQAQAEPTPGAGEEGPRISLDIENESVQDVFNYVLRISGLQANRTGRTIFVAPRLTNEARNVIVRSLRLNQINVGVALNFLVAMGAESAVSRERVVTSVNAVPVGGSASPVTQTQTSTETRVETQRIDFQDSIPLLRGLQVVGDERTNSVSLIGSPRQVDIATSQLVQIDSRRRQVAVNVKIVDVNLLNTDTANTSFSFGIGDSFFVNDGGSSVFNFGGNAPPSAGTTSTNLFGRPVIPNPITGEPFLDAQPNAPFSTGTPQQFANPPLQTGNTQTGPGAYPRPPFGTNNNPLQPGVTNIPETGPIEFTLPSLFQYPSRFLARLQAAVTSGSAKILTDPTLTVQEGQTAVVNLTEEVFGGFRIQTQTDPTTNLTTQAREPIIKQAGLILQVRIDRIDDNGFVSLSVAPTVSALGNTIATADGTIALLQSRQLTSGQLRLRDGQTLILSGIIQESDRVDARKVPILGDIPILGALFRSTTKTNSRQEVIVLLTPQVLDDSQNASFGYNYTPSPDARELLERQRFQAPR